MAKRLPTFKPALPTRLGHNWGTMLDPGAVGEQGELVAVFSRGGRKWVAELDELLEDRDGRQVWSTNRTNKRHRKGQVEPVAVVVVDPKTVKLPDPEGLTVDTAVAFLKVAKPKQGYSFDAATNTVEAFKKRYNRRANGTIIGLNDGMARQTWETYRLDVVEAARKVVKYLAQDRVAVTKELEFQNREMSGAWGRIQEVDRERAECYANEAYMKLDAYLQKCCEEAWFVRYDREMGAIVNARRTVAAL